MHLGGLGRRREVAWMKPDYTLVVLTRYIDSIRGGVHARLIFDTFLKSCMSHDQRCDMYSTFKPFKNLCTCSTQRAIQVYKIHQVSVTMSSALAGTAVGSIAVLIWMLLRLRTSRQPNCTLDKRGREEIDSYAQQMQLYRQCRPYSRENRIAHTASKSSL
jgi:hypothetical protein